MQQFQPLRSDFESDCRGARQVAARSAHASRKPKRDRVTCDEENDRNRFGRVLECQHSGSGTCGNHGDPTTNELGRKCRELVVSTLRPAICNCHVLAINKASVFQTLVHCAQTIGIKISRIATKKPDNRLRRLLRARRERPWNAAPPKTPRKSRRLMPAPQA